MRSIRNSKGMTLIEIMIVVAIIGGLMATLGGKVFGNKKKADVQQAKIQIGEIGKALELYALDCSSFPKTSDGLNALVEDTGSCDNWGPESYMKKNNLTDPWKNDFVYQKNGSNYVIISYGADGEEGGKDFEEDINSDDL